MTYFLASYLAIWILFIGYFVAVMVKTGKAKKELEAMNKDKGSGQEDSS